MEAGLVRSQQPCAAWRAAAASIISGHERQFPQNSATTTSAAINELESVRISTLSYRVSHHRSTRNARNVFQRLGSPGLSISKQVFPGCRF